MVVTVSLGFEYRELMALWFGEVVLGDMERMNMGVLPAVAVGVMVVTEMHVMCVVMMVISDTDVGADAVPF